MQKFDPYEYIGLVIPGVVVLTALLLLYPGLSVLLSDDLSLGDFGLILIFSLILGHLIQAVGNLYESLFWAVQGGMPTTWPCKKKSSLLTLSQLERLGNAIKEDFGAELSDLAAGRGLTRELNAKVRKSGKTERIDSFNRNYGLLRGVASAFLVVGIGIAIEAPNSYSVLLLVFLAFLVASYRMRRFGIHYARELYVEYLLSHDPVENK